MYIRLKKLNIIFTRSKEITVIHGLHPEWLTLEVTPRDAKTIRKINVRFVERSWLWRWKDASSDIIKILELRDPGIRPELDEKFISSKDKQGGMNGAYAPPNIRPSRSALILELHFKVEEEWDGYIKFQHVSGEEHMGTSYARIKVIEKPLKF